MFRGHSGATGHLFSTTSSNISGDDIGWTPGFRCADEQHATSEQIHSAERLAALDMFVGGVAHEINSSLGAALASAETALAIKDAPDLRDTFEASLRNTVEATRRCGLIVESLLRSARRDPSQCVRSPLLFIVGRTVELTEKYAHQHDVELIVQSLGGNVVSAWLDPLKMELVFTNILRNAIEAGASRVVIDLAIAAHRQAARVTFHDNGRGMSEETVRRAFDSFFTTRQLNGGTGLGLCICRAIVHEHGGTIAIESTSGCGATVAVELPLGPPADRATNLGRGRCG